MDEEEVIEAAGYVCAFIVWMFLTLILSSLIDSCALRFPTPFQRMEFLKSEKAMLENEINYNFATENGIKIKMEER